MANPALLPASGFSPIHADALMLRILTAAIMLPLWLNLAGAVECAAGETAAVVPALERPIGPAERDPVEAGRLLLNELNCLACHTGEQAAMDGFRRREAPDLSAVAGRVRIEHLRAIIADPQHAKPGTPMPRLAIAVDGQRQHAIEAIVHFLAETGGSVFDEMGDHDAAERGKELFTQVGCAACHDRPGAQPLPGSFPLGDLKAKYTVGSLARFLHDPLAVRRSGRMPSLNLSQQEAHDLAHALTEGIPVAPNIAYRVYYGHWEKLPDFAGLKPQAAGHVAGFDLGIAKQKNDFAIQFEGYLHVEQTGSCGFFLSSDDGARLVIDGQTVLEDDGLHPASEIANNKHQLAAGSHHVLVEYFDGGGDTELSVDVQSDRKGPRQSLGSQLTLARENASPRRAFRIDPRLAQQGRQLFSSAGCAACHSLKRDEKKLASQMPAPRLDRLRPDRGCLAEKPRGDEALLAPRFALSSQQRSDLRAALTAGKSDRVAPQTAIARTLATFNCYACHARSGRGGVEAARNDFFATTAREMGDEGRIPPPLDGVGAKLTADYLKQIFDRGAKDRPYMLTRMPRYSSSNVGHLIALLVAEDAQSWPALATLELPEYRIKSDGRFLVGGRAFSCIKCHNFGKYEGEGIRAIDLTTMTRRLRPQWFGRYLRDPPALRPGTRMPAAWPKTGRSYLRNVLDGDSDRQIAAVWAYLSDGAAAAPPFGVGRQPIELKPELEPIVYRNFIAGAGPRGIAVGYPEKVNLAIDGNHLQLVLVWRGPFIDASRHWSQRSEGFVGPLGEQVLPLAGGVPLAELASAEEPWPGDLAKALGYQLRGYELDAQRRPKFHYRWHDLKIDEFYLPMADASPGQPDLLRTFDVSGKFTGAPIYFRAACGESIEPEPDSWFRIDKSWQMRLVTASGKRPVVRKSAGKSELVVPINLSTGHETVRQTIRW